MMRIITIDLSATVEWWALRQQIVFATEHKGRWDVYEVRTPLSALVYLQYTSRMLGRGCSPCSMQQRQFTKALFCPLPGQKSSCLLLSCYPQAGYRVLSFIQKHYSSNDTYWAILVTAVLMLHTAYRAQWFHFKKRCLSNFSFTPFAYSSTISATRTMAGRQFECVWKMNTLD